MISWISVTETTPNVFTDVIAWHVERGYFYGYIIEDGIWRDLDRDEVYDSVNVTHWARINKPGENE